MQSLWWEAQKAQEIQKREKKQFDGVSTNPLQETLGVEIGLRLLEMESIQAFPGAAEVKPAKTHLLPYKHYNEESDFHWDPFQQSLVMSSRFHLQSMEVHSKSNVVPP